MVMPVETETQKRLKKLARERLGLRTANRGPMDIPTGTSEPPPEPDLSPFGLFRSLKRVEPPLKKAVATGRIPSLTLPPKIEEAATTASMLVPILAGVKLGMEGEAILRKLTPAQKPAQIKAIQESTALSAKEKTTRIKIIEEGQSTVAAEKSVPTVAKLRAAKAAVKTPVGAEAKAASESVTPQIAEPQVTTAPTGATAAAEARIPPPVPGSAVPPAEPPIEPPVTTGGVPPAGVPLPTDPLPPKPAGNTFLGDFRPIDNVISEVVTSDNPVLRFVAGRTGVNPSILQNTPVGKALTAYHRQVVAGEQLKETALAAALDAKKVKLPIDKDGFYGTTGKLWQDVFSHPSAYTLAPAELSYANDYVKVVQEAEALRVAHGLKPLGFDTNGWFYVPRQVKTVRGVELPKPSNPHLQRLHDEATDGFAAGVRYDNNPRATLDLHLRTTLREIEEAELSRVLEPLSITASTLVSAPVRIRLRQAIANLRLVERLARQKVQAAAAKSGKVPMPSTFSMKVAQDAGVISAKGTYQSAKTAYTKAMEAARRKSVAPGALFNRPDLSPDDIGIAVWRNRFFPQAEADALNGALGLMRPKTAAMWTVLEKLGNTIRFLASVGDFAAPFIQGLPLLFRNPVSWGKATARHYQAWFSPRVQARYINSNLPAFQEMAKYGVPVGDTEFFRALQPGGGFSAGQLISRLPKGEVALSALNMGGRQTFGRFQSSYNTFLTMARGELWKAHHEQFADNLNDLGSLVRNMTGGLDSRALGVGPAQRSVEGMWLAFSPRLLRSTIALLADAPRLNTMKGREAAKTLGALVAGVTATYIAAGIALGKSEDDIRRGLNPLSGRYFLSHEINGDLIGVGGQVRAITQLIAAIISASAPGGKPIQELASLNRWENPFIQFWMFRGAPAINIAQGTAEAVTGANVAPFDDIQSTPDLIKHIGTSALPFAVQGMLDGEQTTATIASLIGARTSAATSSGVPSGRPAPGSLRRAPPSTRRPTITNLRRRPPPRRRLSVEATR